MRSGMCMLCRLVLWSYVGLVISPLSLEFFHSFKENKLSTGAGRYLKIFPTTYQAIKISVYFNIAVIY